MDKDKCWICGKELSSTEEDICDKCENAGQYIDYDPFLEKLERMIEEEEDQP